jgi:hypothetical protein
MKIKTVIVFLALCIPGVLLGQTAKVLKQSGIKKLNVFVGIWQAKTTLNGGPQNTSAISTCRWSANGNYLIADQMVLNGKTKTNNLSIYSYDPQQDNYKLSIVGVPGMKPFAIGVTYKGDEFIYSSTYTDNGKKVYNRTLNDFISPSYYTFKVQSSTDSLTWTTTMEGKSIKIQNRLGSRLK